MKKKGILHKKDDRAVSAVIGVVLMVAVTIAMAAVAYAYFTGMIGGNQEINAIVTITQNPGDVSISVSGVQNGPVNSSQTIVQLLNQTSGTPDLGCTGTLQSAGENIRGGDVIVVAGAHTGVTYTVQLLYKGYVIGSCTYLKP